MHIQDKHSNTISNNPHEGFNFNNNRELIVFAIIPAYNESKNIAQVIKETQKHVNLIIVVDDGSTDNTLEISTDLNAYIIRNTNNLGKGMALKKAFMECLKHSFDVLITLDADGQHDPSDIPRLVEPIKKGLADIVIGSRYSGIVSDEIPKYRRLGLLTINKLHKIMMKSNISDSQSGFRAYKRNVLDILLQVNSKGYGVETEQLAIAESYGFSIVEIPIKIKYKGLVNTSKKNPIEHGTNILSIILKMAIEKRPLLFFGLGGVIMIIVAMVTATDILLIFNSTRYFSIPLSLIVLGLMLLGFLLVFLSFILYGLNRIRQRIDKRY